MIGRFGRQSNSFVHSYFSWELRNERLLEIKLFSKLFDSSVVEHCNFTTAHDVGLSYWSTLLTSAETQPIVFVFQVNYNAKIYLASFVDVSRNCDAVHLNYVSVPI